MVEESSIDKMKEVYREIGNLTSKCKEIDNDKDEDLCSMSVLEAKRTFINRVREAKRRDEFYE